MLKIPCQEAANPWTGQQTGMGLWLVWGLVHRCFGNCWAEEIELASMCVSNLDTGLQAQGKSILLLGKKRLIGILSPPLNFPNTMRMLCFYN